MIVDDLLEATVETSPCHSGHVYTLGQALM